MATEAEKALRAVLVVIQEPKGLTTGDIQFLASAAKDLTGVWLQIRGYSKPPNKDEI